MRISDWSSDVCSSDLREPLLDARVAGESPLRHGDRHALVTGIGSHGVDVGDYKRAQLEEVEKVVEPVRVRTADLHYRSEEHTSELQSLMRISYAVFCLKKKTSNIRTPHTTNNTID